jgi:hypothetical protein
MKPFLLAITLLVSSVAQVHLNTAKISARHAHLEDALLLIELALGAGELLRPRLAASQRPPRHCLINAPLQL